MICASCGCDVMNADGSCARCKAPIESAISVSRRLRARREKIINMIWDERRRQVSEEGWTEEHDDQHVDGEMALAAAVYASPIDLYDDPGSPDFESEEQAEQYVGPDTAWPSSWHRSWDKRAKHGRMRQLTIAGALIMAEMERLIRAEERAR